MRWTAMWMATLTTLAIATPALGEACTPTTSEPELDAAGTLYVDGDRMCCSEFDVFWVYVESNGIAGLQRADEFRDDTCGGQIPADTLVF